MRGFRAFRCFFAGYVFSFGSALPASNTTATTSTTRTTTTTSTTSTATTTTSTVTTTIPPLSLSASPTIVTGCADLIVAADAPARSEFATMRWSCEPRLNAMCYRVMDAVALAAPDAAEIVVGRSSITAAADDARLIGQDKVTKLRITAEAVRVDGLVSARGADNITFDINGNDLILANPGQLDYTYLDDYVQLEASVITCRRSLAAPAVEWFWSDADLGQFSKLEQTGLRLRYATRDLFKGRFIFRVRFAGRADMFADFVVSISGVPPPKVTLVAPYPSSAGCDSFLDASSSEDPGNSELHFSWTCSIATGSSGAEAQGELCDQIAKQGSSSVLRIPGGMLKPGSYEFTVTVARHDAASNQSTTLELIAPDGPLRPVVGISEPGVEVSAQHTFSLSATVSESGQGGCVAPPWRAWYLLPFSGGKPSYDNATLLSLDSPKDFAGLGDQLVRGSLLIQPPLPGRPGQHYIVRLVLSDSQDVHWSPEGGEAFAFDSSPFLLDPAPLGGTLRVYPPEGTALETRFRLSSLYWEDDDLPLEHCFFWGKGSIESGGADWNALGPWSRLAHFENMLFPESGTVAVKVAVRDALGSTSFAQGAATLVAPEAPLDESALFGVLEAVISNGNPLSIVAAVSSVAAAPFLAGAGEDLAESLLDIVLASDIMADPTPETVNATVAAVRNIMLMGQTGVEPHSNDTSPTVPLGITLASKLAHTVGLIATSAGDMRDGLHPGTAGELLSAVSTLFATVAARAGGNITAGASPSSNLSPEQQLEEERQAKNELSDQLSEVVSVIGDSAMVSARSGDSLRIETEDGLSITMLKQSSAKLEEHAVQVGDFSLPALSAVFGPRRMSACLDPTLVIQALRWSTNPYAYHGAVSSTNLSRPVDVDEYFEEDCCKVHGDGVSSIRIRACARTVEATDLAENVTVDLAVARQQDDNATFIETRICQYWDDTSEQWNTSGCHVLDMSDDRVQCSCNRFGSFAIAFRIFTDNRIPVEVPCGKLAIISEDSFSNLSNSAWFQRRGTLVVWMLVLLHIIIVFRSWVQMVQYRMDYGLTRKEFIYRQAAVAPDGNKRKKCEMKSWERMQAAAAANGKSYIQAWFLWRVQKHTLGSAVEAEEELTASCFGAMSILVMLRLVRILTAAEHKIFCRDLAVIRDLKDELGDDDITKRPSNEDSAYPPVEDLVGPRSSQVSAHPIPLRINFAEMEALKTAVSQTVDRHQCEFLANSWVFTRAQFWLIFRSYSPVFKLTQLSVTMGWGARVLAFCSSTFIMLACSSLFLEGASIDYSTGSLEHCQELDFWVHLPRDMLSTAVAFWISAVPVVILLKLHRLMPTFSHDPETRKKRVERRLLLEALVCAFALVLLLLSLLVIMSFLANARLSDADHLLVSLLFYIIVSWVFIPLAYAKVWQMFARTISREPALAVKVGSVLLKMKDATARAKEEEQEELANKLDPRPPWMRFGPPPPETSDESVSKISSLAGAGAVQDTPLHPFALEPDEDQTMEIEGGTKAATMGFAWSPKSPGSYHFQSFPTSPASPTLSPPVSPSRASLPRALGQLQRTGLRRGMSAPAFHVVDGRRSAAAPTQVGRSTLPLWHQLEQRGFGRTSPHDLSPPRASHELRSTARHERVAALPPPLVLHTAGGQARQPERLSPAGHAARLRGEEAPSHLALPSPVSPGAAWQRSPGRQRRPSVSPAGMSPTGAQELHCPVSSGAGWQSPVGRRDLQVSPR